jgi:hypothetical protein
MTLIQNLEAAAAEAIEIADVIDGKSPHGGNPDGWTIMDECVIELIEPIDWRDNGALLNQAAARIRVLEEALRQIKNGSEINGRWIEQAFGEAIDDANDPECVPDGFYDLDNPPAQDTEKPAYPADLPEDCQALLIGGEWTLPALWEAYDGEEQDGWVASVADIAKRALLGEVADEDERDDDEAILPDGTRCTWDERLRTVGAIRVRKGGA